MVRYYSFIEITSPRFTKRRGEYEDLQAKFDNFAMQHIREPDDIYPVFRELFRKQTVWNIVNVTIAGNRRFPAVSFPAYIYIIQAWFLHNNMSIISRVPCRTASLYYFVLLRLYSKHSPHVHTASIGIFPFSNSHPIAWDLP